MPTPGILMRLCTVPPNSPVPRAPNSLWSGNNTKAAHKFISNDCLAPNSLTMYFLSDIAFLTSDQQAFDQDFESHASFKPRWIICSLLAGRNKGERLPFSASTLSYMLPTVPGPDSVLVVDGNTSTSPRDDDKIASHDYTQHDGEAEGPNPEEASDRGLVSWRKYKVEEAYPWGGDKASPTIYTCYWYHNEESTMGREDTGQENVVALENKSKGAFDDDAAQNANERRVWRFDREIKARGGVKKEKSKRFDDMW